MKRVLLIALLSLLTVTIHYGQSAVYSINKAISYPEIDGYLTDSVWRKATVADQFTTTLPRFGATPKNATAVRMLAFPNGICLAVDCKTTLMRSDGSERDEIGNADYFSVGFDTWNDDQNAFVFTVTAAGQLIDQRVSSVNVNTEFNASWKAVSRRTADGWTAEMWIPYKALRFPTTEGQDWGIQFTRYDRSSGETATWAPQDPLIRDKILQYGQLEGLVSIQQRMSLGMTAMGSAVFQSNYNYYGASSGYRTSETPKLYYALDGRVSFNSATTLDVNILPDGFRKSDFSTIAIGPNYVETPISRPLITEENGLFDKSGTLWAQPTLFSGYLSRFYPLQPGETISSFTTIKSLNTSRFTTRTKGGLGIGINNTLFDQPDFFVSIPFSSSTFSYRTVPYPVYPNYNQIAVEKAFRNNSWVQFSNSNLYLKNGMTTNLAALGGQWRDMTNRFEVKGQYQLNTQFTSNNGAFSVADGYLSAGKVNGKYTWGATWVSPEKTTYGVLLPFGSFVDLRNNHQLNAHFTKTNYTPRSARWQNISQSITSNSYLSTGRINEIPLLISAKISGLDQKFRTWSGSIGTSPVRAKEVFYFSGAEFQRKLFIPISVFVGYSTDARKKWVLHSAARYNGNFDHAAPQIISGNVAQYVMLHRKLTLSANTQLGAGRNQNNVLTISGVYYPIRKSNNLDFKQTFALDLFFSPKLQLNVYGGVAYGGYTHQQAYSIQPDGSLSLLAYSFPPNTRNFEPKWLGGFSVSCYFAPASMLKLSVHVDDLSFYNSVVAPVFYNFSTRQTVTNLSFLYNINS